MSFTIQAPAVFAAYVHQLSPFVFGTPLRWYGLAYLAGFLAGYVLLKRMAERKLWVLAPEKTADFIAAVALLGVFAGGRLGYVLFYLSGGIVKAKEVAEPSLSALEHLKFWELFEFNRVWWDTIASDPLVIFRVWEGGMASHGGIIGVAIFTYFYARRHKVSWTGLGDGISVVAPIGLLCGRIANFINGELYGRVANGVAWAVKFPDALINPKLPESDRFNDAMQAAITADDSFLESLGNTPQGGDFVTDRLYYFHKLVEASRKSDVVADAISPYLEPRHPSQLYQGLLEGALLFAILWVVRVKFPRAPHGLLTGLFFGIYATFRIIGEQFREPDSAWVIKDVLTQGQFLSLFMYLFSAAFLIFAIRNPRKAESSLR